MIDLLIQIGLSNVCIALVLAIIALVVERSFKRPQLSYLLWLLVFIKLLTPPLVSIPVLTVEGLTDNTPLAVGYISQIENQKSASSSISLNEVETSSLTEIELLLLRYGKTWMALVTVSILLGKR